MSEGIDTTNETDGQKAASDWPARFETLAQEAKDQRLKRFYEAGCVSADTPMEEVPMVAVDFETTGLDPNHNSIVSIGVVPFDLNHIQLSGARHWLVKPPLPLHQTSVTIHGITHSDIDKAPDLDEVLEEVLDSLKGRIPVVHYRAIERPFMNVAVHWRTGEGIDFPLLDTMAIEAFLNPNRQPTLLQKLRGRKPVSIRLSDSRVRYRLPHYPSHNALVDALATAELLMAQIRHHFSPETPIGDLWL
ncbi:3'-5' exonuclease [Marinobacter halotolerans]|uniref:3'-5' exonuclease n=1 Tax=Marinobacter halotolerans TaxID=1569211 RepID=UPI001248C3A8|nr:3'-5' exonuclease [Marinobacter halotolerans]